MGRPLSGKLLVDSERKCIPYFRSSNWRRLGFRLYPNCTCVQYPFFLSVKVSSVPVWGLVEAQFLQWIQNDPCQNDGKHFAFENNQFLNLLSIEWTHQSLIYCQRLPNSDIAATHAQWSVSTGQFIDILMVPERSASNMVIKSLTVSKSKARGEIQ